MMLQVMAVFSTSSRQHKVFLNRSRISQQLMGIYRKLTTNDVEMTADNFKVRETLLQTSLFSVFVRRKHPRCRDEQILIVDIRLVIPWQVLNILIDFLSNLRWQILCLLNTWSTHTWKIYGLCDYEASSAFQKGHTLSTLYIAIKKWGSKDYEKLLIIH